MFYRRLLLGLLLANGGLLFAQYESQSAGARFAAMGQTVTAQTGLWSLSGNQAGLSGVASPLCGIYYENRFLMQELGLRAAALALPIKNGVLGFTANQMGFSLYRENLLGLAYARSLGPRLAIGLQLDYLAFQQGQNYSNHQLLTFELGLQYQATEQLRIGAHVFNPQKQKTKGNYPIQITSSFQFGILYSIEPAIHLTADFSQTTEKSARIGTGIEYIHQKKYAFRAGFSSTPAQYSFGFGLPIGPIYADFSSRLHPVLGFSPQVGLSIPVFKKKKQLHEKP